MKRKIKALLIDLDGTLVDSREAYMEAFKAAMKAIGKTTFNHEAVFEVPKRLEQGLPIEDLIGNKALTEKFLEKYLSTYYEATLHKAKPFPNVSQTLEKLSEKLSLALITMRFIPKEKLEKELKKLGFHKYFCATLTALDVKTPKPSPEAILKCLKSLNVHVSECAVVGDSIVDIRSGKLAGAKTVAVLSGLFREEELRKEKPDVIIRNFNEILTVPLLRDVF